MRASRPSRPAGDVAVAVNPKDPRYAALKGIMAAKKKPLDVKSAADLLGAGTPRLQTGSVRPPAARGAGIKVKSVEELVAELQGRGLI